MNGNGTDPCSPPAARAVPRPPHALLHTWRLWLCRRIHRASRHAPRIEGILLVLRVGEFAGGTWCEFVAADTGRPCVGALSSEWKKRLPPPLAAEPGRTDLAGLRALDCFCGLGGWSFALERAGITDLSGADNHMGRLRLHAANFPECDCIHIDFHDVAGARRILNAKKGFALATVSSPCQDFSTKDASDPNRDLF